MPIKINEEKVRELLTESYEFQIMQSYGDEGIAAFRSVLEILHDLGRHIDHDIVKGSIVVFRSIGATSVISAGWSNLRDIAHAAQECPLQNETESLVVEVCSDGTLRYVKNAVLNLASLSEGAIIYIYRDKHDHFIIKGVTKTLENPYGYVTWFGMPTYRELGDALEEYKRRIVKTCNCDILSRSWRDGADGPRLFFTQGPEKLMRKSLTAFLNAFLRGTEVDEENPADDSHPVDITVSWTFYSRIALIEIKWLGQSSADDGHITADHKEPRANAGAKQLAEYIDEKYGRNPLHLVRGYLVVIDGRRRNLSAGHTSISREDGFYYKDSEITYNPAYHQVRMDFEPPTRMFADPKLAI